METLYKTITAESLNDLDYKVNKYLKKGWELYSNPYTSGWKKVIENEEGVDYVYWEIEYYQAIIKKTELYERR